MNNVKKIMNITLNNREEKIDCEKLTVSELLKIKNFTFKMLVIKVNNKLVKKEYYDSQKINEGDEVSVIHLICGG